MKNETLAKFEEYTMNLPSEKFNYLIHTMACMAKIIPPKFGALTLLDVAVAIGKQVSDFLPKEERNQEFDEAFDDYNK